MDPYNRICVYCGEKVLTDCRHFHNFDCYDCSPENFCDVCGYSKFKKSGFSEKHNIILCSEVERELRGLFDSII